MNALPTFVALCLLCALPALSETADYSTLSSVGCAGYYAETASLDASGDDFPREAITRARVFMETSKRTGATVRALTIIQPDALKHPTRTLADQSYDDWRTAYLEPEYFHRVFFLAIGNSAALAYITDKREVAKVLLSGPDPFRVGTGEIGSEIKPFNLGGMQAAQSGGSWKNRGCSGLVFVQASAALSTDMAGKIAREVYERLSVWRNVSVVVRNDDWFYGFGLAEHGTAVSGRVPVPPKSQDEFAKLPQFICSAVDGPAKIDCRQAAIK